MSAAVGTTAPDGKGVAAAMSQLDETTQATQGSQRRHDREVRESRRHERQLLVREVVCLVLIGAFVVVRQLWLA